MDFWLNMGITVLLSALKESVKNEKKKAEMKRAMLKVRNVIDATYADDPDFA